ncbi:MAG: hypothetical protein R3D55_11735 [Chloroflexota bacterium]
MRKTTRHILQLFVLFILVAALVACGGEADNTAPNNVDDSAVQAAAVETAVPPTATATLPPPVIPTVTLPPPAVVNDEPTPPTPQRQPPRQNP